jgi:hypothetical protein
MEEPTVKPIAEASGNGTSGLRLDTGQRASMKPTAGAIGNLGISNVLPRVS